MHLYRICGYRKYPKGISVEGAAAKSHFAAAPFLHCAGEMLTQHVEQLHFGRAVHGDCDPVTLADAHGHNLHGAGEICPAGTHFQSADRVGIALGQLGKTAGGAKKHGKIVPESIGESLHKITL